MLGVGIFCIVREKMSRRFGASGVGKANDERWGGVSGGYIPRESSCMPYEVEGKHISFEPYWVV